MFEAPDEKQLELLNRYLDGESPEALERQLEFLEQKQTIRQKLLGPSLGTMAGISAFTLEDSSIPHRDPGTAGRL